MKRMGEAIAPEGETILETERLVLRRWVVSDAAVQRRLWQERDLTKRAGRRARRLPLLSQGPRVMRLPGKRPLEREITVRTPTWRISSARMK